MPPTKLVAVALALALAAGCSGGDDDDDARGGGGDDTETSSTELTKPEVALEVTRAELVSPHQALGPLDGKTRDAAVAVVEDLLRITSAEPLGVGKAGGGFADLFTPDAGARAAGADRAAFFDEGLPVFGELDTVAATVELTGLAGGMDPATKLVVATFTWDVVSANQAGNRVTRTGEVSLVPDDGEWRIAAYDVTVERTVDSETTTTTAEHDE